VRSVWTVVKRRSSQPESELTYRREPIMSNSEPAPPDKGDSENPLIWLGKLVLTVVAGILLAKFGVRVSDNLKL